MKQKPKGKEAERTAVPARNLHHEETRLHVVGGVGFGGLRKLGVRLELLLFDAEENARARARVEDGTLADGVCLFGFDLLLEDCVRRNYRGAKQRTAIDSRTARSGT